MTLPSGFQFSQSNLQDYIDCQRRFQLHSLLRLRWPAIEAQPVDENEYLQQLGSSFHYFIRQHQSGIPLEQLTSYIHKQSEYSEGKLVHWWDNYRTSLNDPGELEAILHSEASCFPEYSLSIPFAGYRLIAKYDLLVIDPAGSVTIIDWKTSQHRPRRYWLLNRVQTRIYPYILVRSGLTIEGSSISPDQVIIRYWFANFPTDTEHIVYSQEQYTNDEHHILGLVEQILSNIDGDYPLTHNKQHCHYCVYRSLCDRGIQAGSTQDRPNYADSEDTFFDIDFDRITEIEY